MMYGAARGTVNRGSDHRRAGSVSPEAYGGQVKRVGLSALGVIAICVLTSCGTAATPQAPVRVTAPPTTVTANQITTPEVTTPTVAPPNPAPAEVSQPAAPPATTPLPAPAAVMPDVLCMDLQAAQDTIQAAGVFFSRSDDATGQGRAQMVDRNWVVVGQTPAAGSAVAEAEAVLSVVKDNEPNDC